MAIERRWLKISEVCEYLGGKRNEKSIYRACRAGLIPYTKTPGIGVRVDKIALDALLERNRKATK